MIAGEHLVVRRRGYSHHGIAAEDATVIHFSGEPGSKRAAAIVRSTLDEFCAGGEVRIVRYGQRHDLDSTLSRATGRLGETGYHLVFNNCEHFARWCATGSAASDQVRIVGSTAGTGAVSGVAATGAVAGVAPSESSRG